MNCLNCGGIAIEDDEWIMLNVCCECGYKWVEKSKQKREKRLDREFKKIGRELPDCTHWILYESSLDTNGETRVISFSMGR